MLSLTGVIRVGTDPETRSAGGTPVVSFRGVSSEKRKNGETSTWLACSFFGERATKVAPYIRKGEKIAVTGTLSTREYEHKGEKRTSVELRINDVELLGTKREDSGTNDAPLDRDDGDIPF